MNQVEHKERTLEELADAIEAALEPSYDLTYIDYRDQLSPEQVARLVRGDLGSLMDNLDDFVSESRWDGASDVVDDAAKGVCRAWGESEGLLEGLGWSASLERGDLISDVRELDSGDWLRALIGQTPDPLLRINVVDEDHCWSFQEVTPEEVLTRVEIPATPENVRIMDETLAECSPEYSVLLGYWIVSVDLETIYNLQPVSVYEASPEVEIVNPHLYLGNPFSGSGWISEEPLEGVVRVKLADLRTDKDAFGYSVDEVYGGLTPSDYTAEIRVVVEKEQQRSDPTR